MQETLERDKMWEGGEMKQMCCPVQTAVLLQSVAVQLVPPASCQNSALPDVTHGPFRTDLTPGAVGTAKCKTEE